METLTAFLVALTALTAALGGSIVAIIKVYKDVKKEAGDIPRKIKKQSTIDMVITQAMEEAKEFLNADRVQIYDFHNGGHYANGRSALKTTCTYEVVRTGISPKQSCLEAIPLSCIPRFVNKLLNDGYMEIKELTELQDSMPATYDLKRSMGINSFYDVVLNNKYGEPIGFLAIQYVKNKYHILRESDKQEVLRLKFLIEKELELLNTK